MAETITVGCKMARGLFLDIIDADGSRERFATLNGTAVKFGEPPVGLDTGGYALTPNVDAAKFAAWMEYNKASSFVRDKLVIAHGKDTAAQAREHAKVPAQFAPLTEDDARKAKVQIMDDKAA